MKVYIGAPRYRWVSYVHERYMDKKHGRGWEESTTRFEQLLEKIGDGLQWVYNHTINLYLDRRNTQKTKIRVDRYDTWSMDHTLAPIILPMLVQLKETKHGYPSDLTEQEWDEILDEMIWAFAQKCRDDWMEDYDYNKWDSEGSKAHQARMTNGFRLFGKYYESLWD